VLVTSCSLSPAETHSSTRPKTVGKSVGVHDLPALADVNKQEGVSAHDVSYHLVESLPVPPDTCHVSVDVSAC
jgi:hypothetical protein